MNLRIIMIKTTNKMQLQTYFETYQGYFKPKTLNIITRLCEQRNSAAQISAEYHVWSSLLAPLCCYSWSSSGVFFQVCMRVWDSNSCTSPVYVWQQENMCFINLHFIKLTITIPCGCSMIRERQGAEFHVSNLETRLCHVIHATWQAICVFFCKLTFLVEENKSRCLYRELFIFLQRIHNTYHGEI